MLQVLGQVDRGHPIATDLPLDPVAVSEGGLQAFLVVQSDGPVRGDCPVQPSQPPRETMRCGYGGGKDSGITGTKAQPARDSRCPTHASRCRLAHDEGG